MNRVVAPGSLSGSFRAPASKSHAHRLLICAALGTAPVTVLCDTFSDDILATIDCLTAMGAQITHEESRISVTPVFASRKLVELCKLPCRESGSTLRFLLPVLGALGLSGGSNAGEKRKALLKKLNLPEHMSANAMLQALNLLYTREELEQMLNESGIECD